MISSNWKLTVKPGVAGAFVFVDYGDDLLEEPEWGLQVGMNVQRIPYGTPLLELTNQDPYVMTITKVFYAASDAAARMAMMESFTQNYAVLGKVPLRLEIRDLATRRFDWASAVFSNPRVRRLTDSGIQGAEAAWSLAHTITAVALARTVIP